MEDANRSRRGSGLLDSDLTWLVQQSAGDIGLRASSLEPSIGGGDVEPSPRQLKAADRQRRIITALSLLDGDERRALLTAHTPLPTALHAAAAAIDPVDDSGCGLVSLVFVLFARDLRDVAILYEKTIGREDGWLKLVSNTRSRVLRIRGLAAGEEIQVDRAYGRACSKAERRGKLPPSREEFRKGRPRPKDDTAEAAVELAAARAVARRVLVDALAKYREHKRAIDREVDARAERRKDARTDLLIDALSARPTPARVRPSAPLRPGRAGLWPLAKVNEVDPFRWASP